jgi:hypothetical protein
VREQNEEGEGVEDDQSREGGVVVELVDPALSDLVEGSFLKEGLGRFPRRG